MHEFEDLSEIEVFGTHPIKRNVEFTYLSWK